MLSGYVKHKLDGLLWVRRPSPLGTTTLVDNDRGFAVTYEPSTLEPVPRVAKPVTVEGTIIPGCEVWFEPGYIGTVVEVRGEFIKVRSHTEVWIPVYDVSLIRVKSDTQVLKSGLVAVKVGDHWEVQDVHA